jgi:type I restriction enzyme R subunit
MLRPQVILDLLANFTSYATHKGKQRIKIIARYQQYEGANKLVERVVAGHPKKGLLWHFQGSGKSLLMLFAARKLRLYPALRNPTVIIVVDRIDLDSQISSTFYAADAPNLVKAESRKDLRDLLGKDVRKIIITTIHKFGESEGMLNDRSNIIVLVDEAHRTQEGDLGRKMREALPNAFLFGLTGTPINRIDRNTFATFGAEEDANGYMSRYGFEDSIRDGATKELHFEPRLIQLHVNQEQIDEAYKELTAGLTMEQRDQLGKKAAKMAVLLKTPERLQAICTDIAQHFQEKVAPNGFGAQVVTMDRECCLLYKQQLDNHLPPEVSDIVMSVMSGEERYRPYKRDRDAEEKLLDRFRDPNDPLKILIVTSKLLTGFDAPILQTMYLDKPMRDHTLLQAICRTNRPYGQQKSHGLIVDYLGVFDDVAKAIQFDEEGITRVVSNIAELNGKLPAAIQKCLEYFPGIDRTVEGYEGLIPAQECLPNNEVRDRYAEDCSYLARLWEAISPDPVLSKYETDYRWIIQVYQSVKPVSDIGRLHWHRLGAKTIELIHQNVRVDAVRDDLETLVVNAELLEAVLGAPDPKKKAKEIEIKVIRRLRKHLHDPRFKELAERLEDLKHRHEAGLLTSVEFLKALLNLATDVVATEQVVPPIEKEERGKSALTELFEDVKNPDTPIIVKRIVKDIDEIVRDVRFDGWQNTHAGEREVKKVLRRTLFKYRLHQDVELFDKAYGYIRQYY